MSRRTKGDEKMKSVIAKCVMVASLLGAIGVAGSLSAESASASTIPQGGASSQTTINPDFAPSGCNYGSFCSYNQGNGGAFCFSTTVSSNLTPGCVNKNDSAYNYTALSTANLHACENYQCAYTPLAHGAYLLYMNQNHFLDCANNNDANKCYFINTSMQNQLGSVYMD